MGPPKKWVFENYTSFGKKQVKKGIKKGHMPWAYDLSMI